MVVKCPFCALQGLTKNLANITPEGIKVIRISDEDENGLKTQDFTIIQAQEYSIVCGNCQTTVIYRKHLPLPQVQTNILMAWGTIMTYYANSN